VAVAVALALCAALVLALVLLRSPNPERQNWYLAEWNVAYELPSDDLISVYLDGDSYGLYLNNGSPGAQFQGALAITDDTIALGPPTIIAAGGEELAQLRQVFIEVWPQLDHWQIKGGRLIVSNDQFWLTFRPGPA
jgi:hypothetical protein